MKMRRWLLATALGLGTLAALSLAGTVVYSRQLDERVTALRVRIERDLAPSPEAVAHAQEFRARFGPLDDELASIAPFTSCVGTPWTWEKDPRTDTDHRILNAGLLTRLEPIFSKLDSVLQEPACQALLRSSAPAGFELSRLNLGRTITWANLLSARAVYEARIRLDPEAAARSLAAELDLSHLLNHGDAWTSGIASIGESRALEALRIILRKPQLPKDHPRHAERFGFLVADQGLIPSVNRAHRVYCDLLAPRFRRALEARSLDRMTQFEALSFCRTADAARPQPWCWPPWSEFAATHRTLRDLEGRLTKEPRFPIPSAPVPGTPSWNLERHAKPLCDLQSARLLSGLTALAN